MAIPRPVYYLIAAIAVCTLSDRALAQGIDTIDPSLAPDLTLEDDFLTPDPNVQPLDDQELAEDVGDIQRLQRPTQTQAPSRLPVGQILLRSSTFTSSNVTGLELNPASDVVFVNQATFLVTPQLGPSTRLVATGSGALTRFGEQGDGNTNSLSFSMGVQQRLTPRTYGQIGWVQDRLYNSHSGDRTLLDNSARLLIGRQDQLDPNLRLDTTYEFRARFTNPGERSRLSNSLGARLRYDFAPDWQGALGYQLALTHFTHIPRFDNQHQIQATTTYTPTPNTFITGYASYLFGGSSEGSVNLENLSFGLGFGINVPLF